MLGREGRDWYHCRNQDKSCFEKTLVKKTKYQISRQNQETQIQCRQNVNSVIRCMRRHVTKADWPAIDC